MSYTKEHPLHTCIHTSPITSLTTWALTLITLGEVIISVHSYLDPVLRNLAPWGTSRAPPSPTQLGSRDLGAHPQPSSTTTSLTMGTRAVAHPEEVSVWVFSGRAQGSGHQTTEAHPVPYLHPAKTQRPESNLPTTTAMPPPHPWPLEPWPWLPWRHECLDSQLERPCSPGPSPWKNIPCSTSNHETPENPEKLRHTCNHSPLHLCPLELWPWLYLEKSPQSQISDYQRYGPTYTRKKSDHLSHRLQPAPIGRRVTTEVQNLPAPLE